MLLTTLLDPAPIFPIRIKYYCTGSVYVANVATYTTGEVLLNSFQNCVGPNGVYNESCKLVYLEKDIKPADTLEELGIKVDICRDYPIVTKDSFYVCANELWYYLTLGRRFS
ncbi:hypothetical protein RirG_221910 [Rhizophagus irregularis DAOM 197198w]|uniref:Uncharacterized protein n=1 Tax=Rhizophagus irregularis (strain DAOM 197198w) TaxID=1432141 RepID=A0A015LLY4_RHIIW|nr:hypothetical protein RirG_221910 [Rhizophagus irregularis DAOM 197198w]